MGAGYDLVTEGETGFVYPSGDVDRLTEILSEVLCDREKLKRMGEAARGRLEMWSPRENAETTIEAVEAAMMS